MTRLVVFVVLLASVSIGYSQTTTAGIRLLAKSKPDGIWLRWAPTDPVVWQVGNKSGYMLERFTVLPNGDLENPQGVILSTTPIRAASQAQMLALAANVPEAEALAEVLYGSESALNARSSILNQRSELENKFGIALLLCDLSRETARAAGLFWMDASAEKGKRYIYRVRMFVEQKGLVLEPGIAVHTHGDEPKLPVHSNLMADFRDRSVALSWPTLFDKGIYTAYHIERATSAQPFERITNLPYVHMAERPDQETAYFVDSLQQNGVEYAYRVIGVTPFGEVGPSSNEVKGRGRDNLNGLLVLREAVVKENRLAEFLWEFPALAEGQIAGFRLARSVDAQGPYQDVGAFLSRTTRIARDEPDLSNTYYVIRAVDVSGVELTRSFPYLVHLEDNDPPAPPQAVNASIAPNGRVTLRWEANQEIDLLGYRVFRSNSRQEEVVEITTGLLSTPMFFDSVEVRQLNRQIFYRIVSVDRNFNVSDYSEWATVLRPDVVPPIRPIITKAVANQGKVELTWLPSSSSDVVRYGLIRTVVRDTSRVLLKEWSASENIVRFDDTTPELGRMYQYTLTAFDSAGNSSSDASGEIFFESGVRPAVTGLDFRVERDKKLIAIKWKSSPGATKTLIYRRINDGKFITYQTLPGSSSDFVDRQLSVNNTYSYRVQLVFPGGIRSAMSTTAEVKY